MRDVPPTPPSTLRRARTIALEHGLRYVYTGNVHDPDGQTTRCPGCGEPVVVRDWYVIGAVRARRHRRLPAVRHRGAGRVRRAGRHLGRATPARTDRGVMTVTARPPAVAGQFYPADPTALARPVDALLAAVPAGAGRAGGGLRRAARRVPLLGPDRRPRVRAAPRAAAERAPHRPHRTRPLRAGARVARSRAPRSGTRRSGRSGSTPHGGAALVGAGLAVVDDAAHAPEHSLEVQLPFLQRVLDPMPPVLPVVVGPGSPDDGGRGARGGRRERPAGTVVLCSTDLSHYLDEGRPVERDDRTVRAVLELRPAPSAPATPAACTRCAVWSPGRPGPA